jgi:polyhydroxyalkanoate synthesis regulator phasin
MDKINNKYLYGCGREGKNKRNFLFLFICLCFFSLFSFSSAVEVIDPNQNPFNNSTNVTNSTNLTNSSEYAYYTNASLEAKIKELIDALIEAKDLNKEEKAYLKSILEASTEERRQYQEALSKLDYGYKLAISDRDKAIADKLEYEQSMKVRMETLDTEMETLRLDNVKTKSYVVAYILFGILFGVFVIEIANYLKKNQKGYFVIRWIRDRIPIKI